MPSLDRDLGHRMMATLAAGVAAILGPEPLGEIVGDERRTIVRELIEFGQIEEQGCSSDAVTSAALIVVQAKTSLRGAVHTWNRAPQYSSATIEATAA